MVAVVFIHAVTSQTSGFQQFILIISGTAVPVFFFLSGGFLLCRYNTLEHLEKYYKKRFVKIFVPLIYFEIMYFIYTFFVQVFLIGVDFKTEVLELSMRWLNSGIPGMGYHLWFMNVIIPFYAIAPLLILLRKKSSKIYSTLAFVWLVFSELNFYFGLVSFPWYLNFINYISFMMLGDILKNIILPKVNINRYIFLVSLFICICLEMILKMSLINDNPIGVANFILHDTFRSNIVVDPSTQQIFNLIAAVSLFCFFYSVTFQKNYTKLANFCFYLYLAHYAIEEVCGVIIMKVIAIVKLNIAYDAWFMILIRALIVLVVASICVFVLNKLFKLLFKKELF